MKHKSIIFSSSILGGVVVASLIITPAATSKLNNMKKLNATNFQLGQTEIKKVDKINVDDKKLPSQYLKDNKITASSLQKEILLVIENRIKNPNQSIKLVINQFNFNDQEGKISYIVSTRFSEVNKKEYNLEDIKIEYNGFARLMPTKLKDLKSEDLKSWDKITQSINELPSLGKINNKTLEDNIKEEFETLVGKNSNWTLSLVDKSLKIDEIIGELSYKAKVKNNDSNTTFFPNEKIITVFYTSFMKKTPSKIDNINFGDIKLIDGIKEDYKTYPSIMKSRTLIENIKKNIKNDLIEKRFPNEKWYVEIIGYDSNDKDGILSYSVQIKKEGYETKTLKIEYNKFNALGMFLKKNINEKWIKDNDGISEDDKKLPSQILFNNNLKIKDSIEAAINYKGDNTIVQIGNYDYNDFDGKLSYVVEVWQKDFGFWKKIPIVYDKFQKLLHHVNKNIFAEKSKYELKKKIDKYLEDAKRSGKKASEIAKPDIKITDKIFEVSDIYKKIVYKYKYEITKWKSDTKSATKDGKSESIIKYAIKFTIKDRESTFEHDQTGFMTPMQKLLNKYKNDDQGLKKALSDFFWKDLKKGKTSSDVANANPIPKGTNKVWDHINEKYNVSIISWSPSNGKINVKFKIEDNGDIVEEELILTGFLKDEDNAFNNFDLDKELKKWSVWTQLEKDLNKNKLATSAKNKALIDKFINTKKIGIYDIKIVQTYDNKIGKAKFEVTISHKTKTKSATFEIAFKTIKQMLDDILPTENKGNQSDNKNYRPSEAKKLDFYKNINNSDGKGIQITIAPIDGITASPNFPLKSLVHDNVTGTLTYKYKIELDGVETTNDLTIVLTGFKTNATWAQEQLNSNYSNPFDETKISATDKKKLPSVIAKENTFDFKALFKSNLKINIDGTDYDIKYDFINKTANDQSGNIEYSYKLYVDYPQSNSVKIESKELKQSIKFTSEGKFKIDALNKASVEKFIQDQITSQFDKKEYLNHDNNKNKFLVPKQFKIGQYNYWIGIKNEDWKPTHYKGELKFKITISTDELQQNSLIADYTNVTINGFDYIKEIRRGMIESTLKNNGKNVLKDYYLEEYSNIIKWPNNLSNIDWTDVKFGNNQEGNPFNGDIDKYKIEGSIFKGVSFVNASKKWPANLKGINWTGVEGLTGANTPIYDNNIGIDLSNSVLKDFVIADLDNNLFGNMLSVVIKGQNIKYHGLKMVGDLSQLIFRDDVNNTKAFEGMKDGTKYVSWLSDNNIDVSGVIKWPSTEIWRIKWKDIKFGPKGEGNPFNKNISSYRLDNAILKDIDVSKVETWPINLINIDWSGIIGLTDSNTPFKGNITSKKIHGKPSQDINLSSYNKTILNGINVSLVTDWPNDLRYINWVGATFDDDNPNYSPFASLKFSKKKIEGTTFPNWKNLSRIIDPFRVKWPTDLKNIDWSYMGVDNFVEIFSPFAFLSTSNLGTIGGTADISGSILPPAKSTQYYVEISDKNQEFSRDVGGGFIIKITFEKFYNTYLKNKNKTQSLKRWDDNKNLVPENQLEIIAKQWTKS